jgi:hypothetical protein
VRNLFNPVPLPTLPHSGVGRVTSDASFQKYKDALRRQLLGRTTALDDILNVLENCAEALQRDLSKIVTSDVDHRGYVANSVIH